MPPPQLRVHGDHEVTIHLSEKGKEVREHIRAVSVLPEVSSVPTRAYVLAQRKAAIAWFIWAKTLGSAECLSLLY